MTAIQPLIIQLILSTLYIKNHVRMIYIYNELDSTLVQYHDCIAINIRQHEATDYLHPDRQVTCKQSQYQTSFISRVHALCFDTYMI